MNREILFRGKFKDKDCLMFKNLQIHMQDGFIYGSLIVQDDVYYICTSAIKNRISYINNGIVTMVEVIPETVGQYTGLTDKNGKKIFEGDILKFNDEVWESCYTSCGYEYDSWEVENYGVVGFDEDRACFDFIEYKFNENSVEADLHENHDIEFADFISELEVIGNIYDNPELFK